MNRKTPQVSWVRWGVQRRSLSEEACLQHWDVPRRRKEELLLTAGEHTEVLQSEPPVTQPTPASIQLRPLIAVAAWLVQSTTGRCCFRTSVCCSTVDFWWGWFHKPNWGIPSGILCVSSSCRQPHGALEMYLNIAQVPDTTTNHTPFYPQCKTTLNENGRHFLRKGSRFWLVRYVTIIAVDSKRRKQGSREQYVMRTLNKIPSFLPNMPSSQIWSPPPLGSPLSFDMKGGG